MTDRERLIKRLIAAASYPYTMDSRSEIELLADYLTKNGVIVPPCKVGDEVYIITIKQPCYACKFCTDFCHKSCHINDKAKQVVKRAKVCSIELGAINKICAEIEETKIASSYKYTCWFEDFGEILFLTREEAGKALKERETK